MKKILFAAVVLTAGMLVSCEKKNNGNNDDPYAGKTNPSTICADNLKAYIPFDGSAVESLGNVQGTCGEGVAYTKGRRGQALDGQEKGYISFKLPQLKDMTSFSIAVWLKQPIIPESQAPVPCYLAFINKENFWNDFAWSIDRREDALTPKLFWMSVDPATGETAYDVWKTTNAKNEEGVWDWGQSFPGDVWSHYVWSYDAKTSEFHVFVNGADVTPEGYVAVVNWNAEPAGEIHFKACSELLINGWRQKVYEGAEDEWMGWMNGQMDELRIYDKGLNAKEAKDLYDAEVSVLDI